MSVNIYKKETDTLQKVAGNAEPINIWTGTSAEYETEKDTIPDGSYVNITDDTDTYELNFPDGTGFYPDIKDGVRGYNTSESRGADTFHPFKGNIKTKTGTFNSISGTVTVDTSVKDIEYIVVVLNNGKGLYEFRDTQGTIYKAPTANANWQIRSIDFANGKFTWAWDNVFTWEYMVGYRG